MGRHSGLRADGRNLIPAATLLKSADGIMVFVCLLQLIRDRFVVLMLGAAYHRRPCLSTFP